MPKRVGVKELRKNLFKFVHLLVLREALINELSFNGRCKSDNYFFVGVITKLAP